MRALLVVLVACGSKSEPEPIATPATTVASKAECESAIAHIKLLDRTKSEPPEELKSSPVLREVVQEALHRRSALLLEHCIADKWPQAVTTCMINAADFPTSELCSQHLDASLSQPQIKKLNADYDAVEQWVADTVRQKVDAEVAGLAKLRDEMCACKTPACRKAVDAKLAKRTEDALVKRASEATEAQLDVCRM